MDEITGEIYYLGNTVNRKLPISQQRKYMQRKFLSKRKMHDYWEGEIAMTLEGAWITPKSILTPNENNQEVLIAESTIKYVHKESPRET